MKKFILLTLLASGLSAHAMPGDNQKNAGQSKEGALEEEAKTQAQAAQQDHAEENLNQRSAFEDAEVMQIDTTQHFVFEESKDPKDELINQLSSFQMHQDTNNVIERSKLASNPMSIQEALALKKSGIPVKVGLIVDSLQNFLNIFNNSNPQNLPFNEWKTAFFGTVSPEKMVLRIDDTFDRQQGWQRCAVFLNANQDHLNPDNFTITIERMRTTCASLMCNPVFPYLTGMKIFFVRDGEIKSNVLQTCLQNNASTLTQLRLTNTLCATKKHLDLAGVLKKMKLVEQLTLVCNNIDDEAMEDLGPAFANMKALRELNFVSYDNISDKAAKVLVDALHTNITIENLDLSHNNISAEAVKYLVDALRTNSVLKKLCLSWNDLGADAVKDLANALRTNTSLKKLCLSWNNIGDKGVKYLVDALGTNITIENLDLSRNNISAEAVKYLVDALGTNSVLKKLYLSHNNLGAEAVKDLANALRTNITIEKLDLSWNNIGDKGVKYLVDALGTNSVLKKLYLSRNNISAEAVKDLANALRTNTSLENLDLSHNDLGADAVKDLANALCVNSTLKALNLSDNNLGADAVKDLANALLTNTSLKELNLDNSNIGDEGAKILSEAISKNSSLERLRLFNQYIGAEGVKSLVNALRTNTSIKVLKLFHNYSDIGDDVKSELREVCRAKNIDLEI